MELRTWVKTARKGAQLTLEKLGEKLGRTKATIAGWEKGDYEPSVSQVLTIARLTKKNPAELDDWPADFKVIPQAADDETTEGANMNGWPLSPELLAALQNADATTRRMIENHARVTLELKVLQLTQETPGKSA